MLLRSESPVVSLADLGTETSGVSLSLSKLKLKELLVEVTSHGAAVQARKNGHDAVAIRANRCVKKLTSPVASSDYATLDFPLPAPESCYSNGHLHALVCCVLVGHNCRSFLSYWTEPAFDANPG